MISSAYVCGEKTGIVEETSFNIGETLNGINNLDINNEFKVMEEKLTQLKAAKMSESVINASMKAFGTERFVTINYIKVQM